MSLLYSIIINKLFKNSMKKNLMWMAAAILTSGLAFTACSTNDLPVEPLPVGPEDNWNKETTVFDFEDGNAVFTEGKRLAPSVQDNADKESKVLQLKNAGNASNQWGFAYYNFADKVQDPTKVVIKFDYLNGNGRGVMTIGDGEVRGTLGEGAGCARYTYGRKGAIFAIGQIVGSDFYVNDQKLGSADEWCNKWLTVEVNVYAITREIDWKIFDGEELLAQSGTTEGEDEEAVFTPGRVDYWQDDASSCNQMDFFSYVNNNASFIDNLSIINAQDPGVTYVNDIKVMFVDYNGKELKESKVISGAIGSKVHLAIADKEPFFTEDGVKYLYAYDNTQYNPILPKGTVVKVVFREAQIYYAVLNCMAGSTLLYRFNDAEKYKFYEGEQLIIYPSLGYGKDGVFYFTEVSTCSDNKKYNSAIYKFPGDLTPTVTGGKSYYIGTVNYTVDENVVYFANFEDLASPANEGGLGQLEGTVNNWMNWTNAPWERLDGGRSICLDADSYVWTEPISVAGTYNVTIYGRNDASTCDNAFTLGLRDAEGNVTWFTDLAIPSWDGGITCPQTVEGVTIPAGSSLVIGNDDAAKKISLDDIKISKPAEE